MDKLPSIDELMAENLTQAVISLDCARGAVDEVDQILAISWAPDREGLFEKRQAAFHKAGRELHDAYSDLFEAASDFEAEAQTLKFFARVKNYIVKDFVQRPNDLSLEGPPVSKEEHMFDDGTRGGILRAITTSFAFQNVSAREHAEPLIAILESNDYRNFDNLLRKFSEHVRVNLAVHEMALARVTGKTLSDCMNDLDAGLALNVRTGELSSENGMRIRPSGKKLIN